jgi:ribonuclease D
LVVGTRDRVGESANGKDVIAGDGGKGGRGIHSGVPRPSSPSTPTATYLDTDATVGKWLAAIRKTPILALDTEGASFHRFVDRIYLLQLSTRDHHAVIDPLPIAAPAILGEILSDPAIEIVFHDADYDLRLLRQDYEWTIRNVFDTRIAAQLLGIKAFGLAALLERSFGLKLDKKHQRADWSMRPLTADMLDYAAQDTMHLLGLRDVLREELEKKERLAWAREEFVRLESIRWNDEEPGLGFLKVKGARDLDRRGLAIFRELVTWRDATALRLDRATFRVVANEVLFEMVASLPADRAALGRIKGMPRGMLEREGDAMLAAIARGQAVAEPDLPRFPKSARWDRDPEFDAKVGALKAVRDAAAARLELDPGVLCSRERMETVARLLPRAVEELASIPEFRKWQVAELGAGFVKALVPWSKSAKDSPYRE